MTKHLVAYAGFLRSFWASALLFCVVSTTCLSNHDFVFAQKLLDNTINYAPLDPTSNISLKKHREHLHKALVSIWPQNEPPSTQDETIQSVILSVLSTTEHLVNTKYWRKRTARRDIDNLFSLARLEIHETLPGDNQEKPRGDILLFLKALEGQVIHRIMGTTTAKQTIAAWVLLGGTVFLVTSSIGLYWWLKGRQKNSPPAPVVIIPPPPQQPAPPQQTPSAFAGVTAAAGSSSRQSLPDTLLKKGQTLVIQKAANAVNTPAGWTLVGTIGGTLVYLAWCNPPVAAAAIGGGALIGALKSSIDKCRR